MLFRKMTKRRICSDNFYFHNVLEVLTSKGKEIKGTIIRNEEIKLSSFTDDIIVCLESLKASIKKLLELIYGFSKVEIQDHIQKSILFLYKQYIWMGIEMFVLNTLFISIKHEIA